MGSRKLALVGGGGVRGPMFVEAAAARAGLLGISEIALLDVDREKLELLGALSARLAEPYGVRVTVGSDPRAALEGADFVVTTVRVGGEGGRVLDEWVALAHGVLGQETTGPGGFAMAMRSIPVVLGYADLLAGLSPKAWLLNFTNPAGLVTQALHEAGHTRAIGICDGANAAQHAVAAYSGADPATLRPEVYGLNHLSWTRAVRDEDGTDLLAPLLRDPGFHAGTSQRYFPAELIELSGGWINEYLYYFYFAEEAVDRLSLAPRTRGEEIVERNRDLLDRLREIGPAEHPAEAAAAYREYERGRRSTYMDYTDRSGATAARPVPAMTVNRGAGGYAAVALEVIEALVTGVPHHTALNVANRGAVDGFADGDVVEISTVVDGDGVRPLPVGPIPDHHQRLAASVKLYERLALAAIRDRSRIRAVQALMAHPLVLSYSRASALVDGYLAAHAAFTPGWS